MLALTPSERRGALVLVLLLLVGAGHDLWRARRDSSGPLPGPAPGLEADRPDAVHPEPMAPAAAPGAGHAAGSGPAADSVAMETTPAHRVAAARRDPVDLNRAGVGDLDGLPGIGPVLARRIVLQRRRFGPYRELDELLAVRGVGPRLLERIRPWAIVHPPPELARAEAKAVFDTTVESRR